MTNDEKSQPGIRSDLVGPRPTVQVDDPETVARTLRALGKVTVQPGPLIMVLKAAGDDPDQVACAIEASPALAGRLLSVTNSAGMGLSRHIDCVRRAVIHLGANRAKIIALAFGLRMIGEGCNLPPEIAQQVWINSLRKAAAARLAAERIDPRFADQAYTLALLQDIGLPLLMGVDLDYYRNHVFAGTGEVSWSEREYLHFGLDHAAVGSRLLQEWDTSSKTCDTVQDHHCPPLDGDAGESLYRLPNYLASLMPHLWEQPTAEQREWMVAMHAQFLAEDYPTPEAFFAAAAKAAAPLHGGDSRPLERLDPSDMQRIIHVLSADTEAMVAQLCHLETALGRQREHLSHLRFQAFTDQLTKVLNRRGFIRLAQRRIEAASEMSCGVCTIVIDLDEFKPVNDQYGHEAGDLVLRGLAKLLRRNLDRQDLIGRMGGDEFCVLLTGLEEEQAKQVAQRLAMACRNTRVRVSESDTVALGMSLGAVYCARPTATLDIDDLIGEADDAMYQRKRNGKGGLTFRRYLPEALADEAPLPMPMDDLPER